VGTSDELCQPVVMAGDLCADNRSVMGFNLIWLTDKVGVWMDGLVGVTGHRDRVRGLLDLDPC
jgi:hypothetical protein